MDNQDNKIFALNEAIYEEKKGILYRYILETVEKPLLEQALEHTYGNQLKAAKILGINRNTMRSKIKKLRIDLNKWKI
ncbi:MAG: helix-turn-helix domain-containing protein [Candidatus Omnitrophica bacterium]|nr:helix-turn-helix domain-containing protein [Candidatus Omnitrophota bacterium]